MKTSKYFEILSHPIRFAILQYLNIDIRSFSDILEGINAQEEVVSSTPQLSFHLKKMTEEDIIVKKDNYYSVSEIGIKLINLISQFENDEFEPMTISEPDTSQKVAKTKEPTNKKSDLPMIKRPKNLNQLISVFEYFEGKNYDYMEEKCFLDLPDCISTDTNPKEWIEAFSSQILPLLEQEKSKDWVTDRYLKLGYGTRGLQDYGLMDASLSVPPLESTFNTLIDLLLTRGKAGIYAETGMGKSRLSLYIASHWSRNFKTPILYVQNPHLLQNSEYDNLQNVLNQNIANDRKAPRWLLIIEDAHLVDEKQIVLLKKLISGAGNRSYSIFVSFTKIENLKELNVIENPHLKEIEQLYNELIPPDMNNLLDLKDQFATLKPYFYEWIKWVAVDIVFDYIPNPGEITLDNKIHDSPWSFVVSLGFLKSALMLLRDSSVTERFPLVLYYSLAQLYIMRSEQGIPLNFLISILNKFFKKDLIDIYGDDWVDNIALILNNWANPSKRLIPPFKYPKNENSMSNEVFITFYHLQWAEEVCNFLDSDGHSNLFDRTNVTVFPTLFKIWSELKNYSLLKDVSFSKWLRDNIRFQLNDQGEILITSLHLEIKEKKALSKFKLDENFLKDLGQSELVNWFFIKEIISN